MRTQRQQKERTGRLNDYSLKCCDDSHQNLIRQSRGRPQPTEKIVLTKSIIIVDHINFMRSRKKRKKSPALLHYSSGRWRDEAYKNLVRQSWGRTNRPENEVQTKNCEKFKNI